MPHSIIEALLVGTFVMVAVALSYNFRDFKLKDISNIKERRTLYLIIFWIMLCFSLLGYIASKLCVFPMYFGISGGIVLMCILLIISIKPGRIEL